MSPTVLCQDGSDPDGNTWLTFTGLTKTFSSTDPENVLDILADVETAQKQGLAAAGFVSYEAGPACDDKLKVCRPSKLPLIWFGLFEQHERIPAPKPNASSDSSLTDWSPELTLDQFTRTADRIKGHLHEGDCYQINFTFPLTTTFRTAPFELFTRMIDAQQCRFGAFIETDDFAICSSSPELFFHRNGTELMSRPMKGTAARGLNAKQDEQIAKQLQESAKNQAENVMIVDMIRNDMGRIADPGTVHVDQALEIERYPTVFQMTSTVSCETSVSLPKVFQAMFPCASITGAPKVKAMELIAELESHPRGAYTGSIGYLLPDSKTCFNVAIRTATIDKDSGTASYGVGSGIVWDSTYQSEYDECLAKARILGPIPPAYDLLETMLFEPNKGVFLLERHLDRLKNSAHYFGFDYNADDIRRTLETACADTETNLRLRLTLDRSGAATCTATHLPAGAQAIALALSSELTDTQTPFFFNKTTHRAHYDRLRSGHPDVDDVIIRNTDGYVTETTIGNIVIEKAGHRLTPPLSAGLLPGVFRQELLSSGQLQESDISVDDLRSADAVFLINSVRKWVPATLSSFSM